MFQGMAGRRMRWVVAFFSFVVTTGIGHAVPSTMPPQVLPVLEGVFDPNGDASANDPKGGGAQAQARSPQQAIATATSAQFTAEVEPNGAAATATPLSGGSAVVEGNIVPDGDVDYYSFTAAAGDRIYAALMTSLSASGNSDSVLQLIDSDGSTVLETDLDDGSFGAVSSSIAGAVLPAAGTYYLRVSAQSAADQIRPYRLYLQLRGGIPVAESEPNDAAPGQPLPAGGWVSGDTSTTSDADFYSLALNAGDTVFISLDLDPERDTTEWNGQLGFGLFGTPASLLTINDNGASTPDSEAFFLTVKEAGTYSVYVGVPASGVTFGSYHLSVSVFPKVEDGINCTTYSSTDPALPLAIPAGPGVVSSTLTLPGHPRIADIDVSIQLTHNFMADLDVELTAPGGNTIGLFSDIGSNTSGVQTTMDVTLDDEAATPIGAFTIVQGMRFAPELNYRLAWFDGQDAGGAWTLTLRDDTNTDGGTLSGWSLRVCEPPPPPACPVGSLQVTAFTTDFEAGAAGFTHAGLQDEWELGLPSAAPVTGCNSGSQCFKTDLDNSYNANSAQDLLSPNIDLTGYLAPVVVSWGHRYQMESASYDSYWVEAREVAAPVNALELFRHMAATMSTTVGNPLVTVQEAAGWGLIEARADALAGKVMELRYAVTSDGSVQFGGVAVDDVTVTACRPLSADLAITKTDGVTTAVPGQSITYSVTASNAGPDANAAATVADTFPAALSCTWSCSGSGGGSCTASGSGDINDAVNLPVGATVTYTANCALAADTTGTLTNTATVSGGGINDPNLGNNSASDSDTVTPQADLSITLTDGVTTVAAGDTLTYTLVAANAGPSDAPGATVADGFPAACDAPTWSCVGAGGAICPASGSGDIAATVDLPVGASATFTALCPVGAAVAPGTVITNGASVTAPGGVTDPASANNSALDSTTVTAPLGATISATKGVTGSFSPGGAVVYSLLLTNSGSGIQADNPGPELVDVLPGQLTLVSASANSGVAVADLGTGTVTWNGSIAAGGSVSITIDATIDADATGQVLNQALVNYDADGDGSNEATAPSDDPAVGGTADPTTFDIAAVIPTLSHGALLFVGLLLLWLGGVRVRRAG